MILDGYELIITVVNKGWSGAVIKAAQEAGATGATVLRGRGSGLPNLPSLFGIPLEPEKEIILNAVPEAISREVLEAVSHCAALCKPGTGISLLLPLKGVVGIFRPEQNAEQPPPQKK